MASEPIIFKILLIGESCVGKTELLNKVKTEELSNNQLSLIGIDFATILLNIDNQEIQFKIWDTIGQERFKEFDKYYYKDANGIVFIFDVTNKSSYDNLKNWIVSIENKEKYSFVLFGNKCDCEHREVTKEMGIKLGEEFKIKYFETSYNTGQGIEEGFKSLARDIMKRKRIGNNVVKRIKINNEKKKKWKKHNCHN